MNQIQEHLIGEVSFLWIEAEDAPLLLRPKHFPCRRVPRPAPRVANFFSLSQVEFAALKRLFSINAIRDFSCRTDDLDDFAGFVRDRMTCAVDVFDRSAAKQGSANLRKAPATLTPTFEIVLGTRSTALLQHSKPKFL